MPSSSPSPPCAPQPKGAPRTRRVRGLTKAQAQRRRTHHRAHIYDLDGESCRCCRRHLLLRTSDPFQLAQIHEEPPRSQGGDPLNAQQTITLCARCHDLRTTNRIRLDIMDRRLGTRGPVRFIDTQTERQHKRMRREGWPLP